MSEHGEAPKGGGGGSETNPLSIFPLVAGLVVKAIFNRGAAPSGGGHDGGGHGGGGGGHHAAPKHVDHAPKPKPAAKKGGAAPKAAKAPAAHH